MLDAMVGFSRISPISVAPPWASARAIVAAAKDAKGLRIAYVSDIAGIGVEPEIDDDLPRDGACRCATPAPRWRRSAFDISDGKSTRIRPGAGSGWSASNSPISTGSRSSAST